MKKYILIFSLLLVLIGCKDQIKNDQKVIDEIENTETVEDTIPKVNNTKIISKKEDLIGFWVGWFEKDLGDESYEKDITEDEGLHWTRENKINISIDKIIEDKVIGHSVVAGNKRPFEGTISFEEVGFAISVKEPGDDKYDGTFEFSVLLNDSLLNGKWNAYKNIDIPKRKYNLTKKIFQYNPDQKLDYSRRYGDWTKFIKKKEMVEYDVDELEEEIYKDFAATTENVYSINASNTKLTKKDLENLKKADLLVIRNSIYARHGYSFKHRPLRVFFDAQQWYIPVFTDIKSKLTEIEKENIELLLLYEKNAVEYYDRFGRG